LSENKNVTKNRTFSIYFIDLLLPDWNVYSIVRNLAAGLLRQAAR